MRILILSNSSISLYRLRKELIKELVSPNTFIKDNFLNKNDVVVSVPDNKYYKELESLGCEIAGIDFDRHSKNPFHDLRLILDYFKLIRKVKPDLVITYAIKPNIYGGIACRLLHKKYFINITGLGSTIRNKGLIRILIIFLYKIASKAANKIYIQNESDLKIFKNKISDLDSLDMLKGSGVNLDDFSYKDYPDYNGKIKFISVGRLMRDKGTGELLEAAEIIKKEKPECEFYIVGDFDDKEFQEKVKFFNKKGIINYLGYRKNIQELIGKSNCIIHPTYHEGLSNVLLEAASSGRPIIASNIYGCKETFIDGQTGISVEPKSSKSLVEGIKKFLTLTYEEKKKMGVLGRKHIEENFNRKDVVSKVIRDIENLK